MCERMNNELLHNKKLTSFSFILNRQSFFYSNVGVTITICFVFYISAIKQFILEF